ncbi:vascular endothelial growth factor receptor 2 [Daphnia magna]|uniref:vascular endothelial growth factor receptor 2 n=1 Tax=Daphnia magna TaxID=35525 RepID=UPI001E1BD975|nr:vascular endothelial growth factor receptor 2 [Daphnia magna]
MAERLRPVNIVRIRPRLAIVLAGLLISLAIEGRAKELDKNNGIMLPDKEQQVFTALANISVTCIFIHTAEIKWNIPDYLTKTPGISAMNERLNFTFEKNETHVWSTMSLIKARARDTGYYECYLPLFNEVRVKQYIYVYNRRDAVIMEEELVKFRFEMGEDALVPCNPTHPDVNVQLKRSPQLVIGHLSKEELQRDLLSGPSRHWFRQQFKGLRHRNVSLDDFGSYQCIGLLKNSTGKPTDKRFNLIVSGLDLTRNGSDARDPVEGSNVVLICRAYALSSPPRWTYYQSVDDTAEEQVNISESETPSELGMEINTTKLTVQGESESYYVSILELSNVTANSPQKFGCWAMNKRDKIELATVSFQVTRARVPVIATRNNSTTSIEVVLVKGQARNLTCTGYASPRPKIQWLKDGIEHFDEVYSSGNATVLTLQGTEEEVGSYACRWSNYLGQSFKNFTVTFAEEPDDIGNTVVIAVGTLTVVIILASILIGIRLYLDKKGNLFPGAQALLKGKPKELNDHLSLDEQIEILPYDTRWEFPRHRLKLGVQLGAGCFGRVVKAQAVGVKDSEETVKTVAVKMVRSQTNVAALEALVGELKIMIHLGAHLNVVNLLGACTKSVIKGELLVIVEYCRFGNLQTYLVGHRTDFENQVDEFGNLLTDAEMQEMDRSRNGNANNQDQIQTSSSQANLIDQDVSACPEGSSSSSSSGEVSPGADTFGFYQQDPENKVSHSVSTADLISWSFQIARGMDYLASRKVLHGDLAARNVLLADGGVAKVADFGMSRNMYYEGNYQKESQGLMPVKWMAIESLTDRRFSTQSDVWSYGVLLWEIFTLGKVPYPGMEANHELIRQLEKGYRMEKPDFAPNYFGEIMASCWKSDPKERPTFSHMEQQISLQMESTVSDHYLNLNQSYEKLNQEKVSAPANEPLGLAKALDFKKEKFSRSSSVCDVQTKKPVWNGISLRRISEERTNIEALPQQKTQISNQYV